MHLALFLLELKQVLQVRVHRVDAVVSSVAFVVVFPRGCRLNLDLVVEELLDAAVVDEDLGAVGVDLVYPGVDGGFPLLPLHPLGLKVAGD